MVPRPEFYRSIRVGKISAHRTGIREFRENQLVLENGDALDVDLVILATGWKNDFSFIGQKSWMKLEPGDDGFYLYRHILHPATPGLVFIGRAASVSSILTYSLQAYWLGELLKGNITLPADSDILENIHQMRAWKAKLDSFQRFSQCAVDCTHPGIIMMNYCVTREKTR